MRIGIDAQALSRPATGVARLLRNLLAALQEIDPRNEYFLYSDRPFVDSFASPLWHKRIGVRRKLLPGLPVPGSVWWQTSGVRMVVEDGIDVFWGTCHLLPLALPSRIKTVVSIHDLAWLLFPGIASFYTFWVNRIMTARSAAKALRVITLSDWSRRDLEKHLHVSPEKIEVVYPGIDLAYQKLDPEASAKYISEKYKLSRDYMCTVGTVEPRKNLTTLIEAVRILRERGVASPQLVIAGLKGWKTTSIFDSVKASGLTEADLQFLGFVPEEDMPRLYAGAKLFVMPSKYEGFGLPLVEAMSCGTPVIASNASSIPEVVGDAGILVPPLEPAKFADAIATLANDAELRATLVARASQRLGRFTSRIAADRLLKVFEALCGARECPTPAQVGS
jgi:glycosyltransferase involved in cell wall biosynthesis